MTEPNDDSGPSDGGHGAAGRHQGWRPGGEPRDDGERDAACVDPDLLDRETRAHGAFLCRRQVRRRPGKESMDGAMYAEVWVPKQVRQPYPVVMFHGNGQTGAVWQQTPDGRPGWAYYLSIRATSSTWWITRRAAVRPTFPASTASSASARRIEPRRSGPAPAPSGGDFPRKNKYTQWPSNHPRRARWAIRCSTTSSRARCSSSATRPSWPCPPASRCSIRSASR